MASNSRPVLRVERRLCPHCQEYLSFKTYKTHKRLYYVSSSDQWISKGSSSSCDSVTTMAESAPVSFGEPITSNQEDDPPGTDYVTISGYEQGGCAF